MSSLLDFKCLSHKIHVSNDQLISNVAPGYTKCVMKTEHKYIYRFYIQVSMLKNYERGELVDLGGGGWGEQKLSAY